MSKHHFVKCSYMQSWASFYTWSSSNNKLQPWLFPEKVCRRDSLHLTLKRSPEPLWDPGWEPGWDPELLDPEELPLPGLGTSFSTLSQRSRGSILLLEKERTVSSHHTIAETCTVEAERSLQQQLTQCTAHRVHCIHSMHCRAHCTQSTLYTQHTAHTEYTTHTQHTVCTAHRAHCTLQRLYSGPASSIS